MTPHVITADRAQQEKQVRALLEQGLAMREVVRQTGLPYSSVRKMAMRMGRKMTRSHPNSPDHVWKHAKITNRKKEPEEPA